MKVVPTFQTHNLQTSEAFVFHSSGQIFSTFLLLPQSCDHAEIHRNEEETVKSNESWWEQQKVNVFYLLIHISKVLVLSSFQARASRASFTFDLKDIEPFRSKFYSSGLPFSLNTYWSHNLQLQYIGRARLQAPESQWRQGGGGQHKVKVGAEWIKEKLRWTQRAWGQWEETRVQGGQGHQGQGGREEGQQGRAEAEQAVEKCGHLSKCQVETKKYIHTSWKLIDTFLSTVIE